MKELFPQTSDILFKEEVPPDYGAWLKNTGNKFFLYSEGYKEAGKRLYEFCSKNRFYVNTLIYPIVFNYRQFIELRLKELIIMGYRLLDINKDFANEHSLLKLWVTYKNDVLANIGNVESEILNNIERIISQFNTEDPKSMSFRYPISNSSQRNEYINRDTIDLDNFKKVIDKLIYFLDCQWEMISHYEDIKLKMYRER